MRARSNDETVALKLFRIDGACDCKHMAKVVEYSERPGRFDALLVSESDDHLEIA